MCVYLFPSVARGKDRVISTSDRRRRFVVFSVSKSSNKFCFYIAKENEHAGC